MPVILCAGRRLFARFDDADEPVELELGRTVEGRDATHLRHRLVRAY